MISEDEKREIIEKMTQSTCFIKAPKSTALLRFLFTAHTQNQHIKEDIIEREFFGTTQNIDKETTRVRTNMYYLRKKIELYRKTEGVDAIWDLHIDKGQYAIRFEKKAKRKTWIGLISARERNLLAIVFLLVCTIIWILLPVSLPRLWAPFFTNKKPTTLVLGDSFGVKGTTITGNNGWTRDYSINSLSSFYKLLDTKPELKEMIVPADYSYVTGMAVDASKEIASIFSSYHQSFDIVFASKLSIESLQAGNIIYVGPHRQRPKLVDLFNLGNPYVLLKNNSLRFRNHPTLQDTAFAVGTSGENLDYGIVSRFRSQEGNEQFIFFSDHDMGAKASLPLFTNIESQNLWSKKHLGTNNYFTAIYKVQGRERANMKSELLWVVSW